MVLYFSGTGNSRYVAKRIAEISDDTLLSVNQRIKEHDDRPISEKRSLVFVGPVYAGRLPRIMEDYIRRVNFTGTDRAYFVVTCAQTPWRTEKYVKKLCAEKSFSLAGFHSVIMPQGYIVGGGTQSKSENEKILKEAEPDIIDIAKKIRDGQPFPVQPLGSFFMSEVLNPIMYATMIRANGFTVSDQCSGCGKCVARCPLNNVTLTAGKPTWGKNCTHCMACIGGCPSEAIEYGKKTKGKPRYYLGND